MQTLQEHITVEMSSLILVYPVQFKATVFSCFLKHQEAETKEVKFKKIKIKIKKLQ